MLKRLSGATRHCLALLVTVATGFAQADDTPRELQVTFTSCTEFAGLTGVSRTAIAPLVPTGFILADFGSDTAGAVVRIANCEGVSVDGSNAVPGTVSHIGANLVSPDGTGDINNYTLLYVTDNPRLALRLRQFGLPVRLDPSIAYEITPSGTQLELYASVQPGVRESYLVPDRKPRFFDVGIRYIVFNVMSTTVCPRRHRPISAQYGQDMRTSWLIGKRLSVTPNITA